MSSDPKDTIISEPKIPLTPGFAPGMRFDDYELIEKIGKGGMGEVWRAKDIPGKREVAIKFVSREIENAEEEMERVESMFTLVNGLQHKYICPLYAMKHTPGFGRYIVMKYIPGMTLGKFAREVRKTHKTFPLKTLLEILKPVAAALDDAHQSEPPVVHRDIKPGNIMVSGDPKTLEVKNVQIIDFGLAATFRASMSRVSQQDFGNAGTRLYKAPEQWDGKKQDGASDQYALAVTIYELLTGEFPFESDDFKILENLVKTKMPPDIPGQSEAVNAVLQRALAKTRKERFPCCAEFVAALEAAANEPSKESEKKRKTRTAKPKVRKTTIVSEPPKVVPVYEPPRVVPKVTPVYEPPKTVPKTTVVSEPLMAAPKAVVVSESPKPMVVLAGNTPADHEGTGENANVIINIIRGGFIAVVIGAIFFGIIGFKVGYDNEGIGEGFYQAFIAGSFGVIWVGSLVVIGTIAVYIVRETGKDMSGAVFFKAVGGGVLGFIISLLPCMLIISFIFEIINGKPVHGREIIPKAIFIAFIGEILGGILATKKHLKSVQENN